MSTSTGPVENELGMPVPDRVTLFSSPTAWLRAGDFVAHPTGFSFETRGMLHLHEAQGGGQLGRWRQIRVLLDTLRLGLVLAGGQEPELVRSHHDLQGGGDLDGSRWHWSWCDLWWVRPLPSGGPIQLVCSWEGMGLPESVNTIDSEPMREAARHALRFWE